MEEHARIVPYKERAQGDIEQQKGIREPGETRRMGNRYKEPDTHRENKSAWEWIFGSCMNRTYDLSQDEVEEFGELYEDCQISFENNNPSHLLALSELWNQLTLEQMDRENYKNEKWVSFGFQNKNPTTDFRGGGFLSLLQIISFVKDNSQLVQNEMCSPASDFFFAISSINVTFYLKQLLHCAAHLDPTKDKGIFCNRQSFKTFCYLLVKDPKTFDKFHDLLLKDLFNSWIALRKLKPSTSLIDFPQVEQRFKKKFKEVLASAEFRTFTEFQTAYSRHE